MIRRRKGSRLRFTTAKAVNRPSYSGPFALRTLLADWKRATGWLGRLGVGENEVGQTHYQGSDEDPAEVGPAPAHTKLNGEWMLRERVGRCAKEGAEGACVSAARCGGTPAECHAPASGAAKALFTTSRSCSNSTGLAIHLMKPACWQRLDTPSP